MFYVILSVLIVLIYFIVANMDLKLGLRVRVPLLQKIKQEIELL